MEQVEGNVRREIPDGKVPGLYHVHQPSGAKSWCFRYRFDGKTRKLTLDGGDLPRKEAQKLARAARKTVDDGIDPAPKTPKVEDGTEDPESVGAVVKSFLAKHVATQQNPRSAKETKALLDRWVLPHWSDRKIGEIRRRDVHVLLDRIIDSGAPVSANHTLARLKVLFGFALDREMLEFNPLAGFKKKYKEKARDRVLSDAELVAVWHASDKVGWPYGPLVKLLATTGCRREAIGALRWSEIDLDKRLFSFRQKGDRAHEVPLNDIALETLRALPRFEGSDWVFPAKPRKGGKGGGHFSGWSKAKERLDKHSGVKGATVHDIRRSVSTNMQRLGVRQEVVEEILGHVSGSRAGIVGTYQRYRFGPEKKAALDLWSRYLQELLHPETEERKVVQLHP